MSGDDVSTDGLVSALSAVSSEIVEDYPDDPRGHSHLVLAWLSDDERVHVCCALHEDMLVIVTVYRPSGTLWTDNRRKRK